MYPNLQPQKLQIFDVTRKTYMWIHQVYLSGVAWQTQILSGNCHEIHVTKGGNVIHATRHIYAYRITL